MFSLSWLGHKVKSLISLYQKTKLGMFSSGSNQNSNSLDALLALRGLACAIVVMAHCQPPRNIFYYFDRDLTWLISSPGGVAVKIFFCLSGYLMGKAFYRERYQANFTGIIIFWRNRLLRICPLYYFVALISILFVYPETLKVANWIYTLRILTFTYNQALPIEFNGALWSLSTEMQFYLIVPFIYIFLKHKLVNWRKVIWVFGLIILAGFLLRSAIWMAITSQNNLDANQEIDYFTKYIYSPLLTNLDLFLSGFLVNALLKYQKISPKYLKLFSVKNSLILFLLFYLFCSYYKYYYQDSLVFIASPLTALTISIFIFIWELNHRQSFSIKNQINVSYASGNKLLKTTEILGNLSYGIYLWHLPTLSKIYPIVSSDQTLPAFLLRFAVTFTLSSLLATVTYYLVEIPLARLKIYSKS